MSDDERVTIYACNLGAGGIDRRCAFHLVHMLAQPENIEAGVDVSDYVLDPDQDALCEGYEITSECADLTAEDLAAIELNLVALRALVATSPAQKEESHAG